MATSGVSSIRNLIKIRPTVLALKEDRRHGRQRTSPLCVTFMHFMQTTHKNLTEISRVQAATTFIFDSTLKVQADDTPKRRKNISKCY